MLLLSTYLPSGWHCPRQREPQRKDASNAMKVQYYISLLCKNQGGGGHLTSKMATAPIHATM